jgi:hypothetical protein
LLEFKIDGLGMGEEGSQLRLDKAGVVKLTAKVAALLQPERELQPPAWDQKPYWHLERARIGSTREVPLEVIVNGYPVARTNVTADGVLRDVSLDVKVERSSWVALRILASSHTNPIWVLVDGKPLAPSRRSVEWCMQGVDRCWSQKQRFIKSRERKEAEQAYEHARAAYRSLLARATEN